MLIDTHCHLHDRDFFSEKQAEEMLERAHKNGVLKIVCIGTDPVDSLAARDFAAKHEGVYWTYGTHPEEAGSQRPFEGPAEPGKASLSAARPWRQNNEARENRARSVLQARQFCHETRRAERTQPEKGCGCRPIAIGEVGLDYHSEGYDREAQIRLFEEMLQLANDNNLPVVFHVRNAFDDFLPVVANFPKTRGVVHSFTDSKKTLKKILETTDFYVGVNGLATYSTLPTPPLERILLETDAPFLTPKPFRGIINEPGYILNIAQWLSQKLDVDFKTIEKETTKNAERLYGF